MDTLILDLKWIKNCESFKIVQIRTQTKNTTITFIVKLQYQNFASLKALLPSITFIFRKNRKGPFWDASHPPVGWDMQKIVI